MSCYIPYKKNAGAYQIVQKREQYFANNTTRNSEEEESIDDNDQTLSCSEDIAEGCIQLMENGNSPFKNLQIYYGEYTPIFNNSFLDAFIQYFSFSLEPDLDLTYYIINGPVENATNLIILDFFNILYANLPINFDIIHHLLSQTAPQGKIKFIETRGIYILCYFISDPENAIIISQIFSIISDQDIDFFAEILPPNAFYPINCNFDTTIIFKFKDFIKGLFEYDDFEIISLLIHSLKRIFHKSDKTIQKLGNLVFKQLFIKKQFLFDGENQVMIPDLIELFNLLSDQFDFEVFKPDLIDFFYSLIESYDFNQKLSIIPSFLSLIDNILLDMLPPILEANTLQIIKDMVFIENNSSILPNIIETVSDIASQIILCKDEYDAYLIECHEILDIICDHDDTNISNLAKSAISLIDDVNSNFNIDDEE